LLPAPWREVNNARVFDERFAREAFSGSEAEARTPPSPISNASVDNSPRKSIDWSVNTPRQSWADLEFDTDDENI
jgi:hypothetical protein